MTPRVHGRAALLTGIAFLLPAAPSAEATFPGANGRVAYVWEGAEPAGRFDLPFPGHHLLDVRPNGTGRRLIALNAYDPAYAPGGRLIAYGRRVVLPRNRGSARPLFVARTDRSRRVRVTPKSWSVSAQSWAPRGRRLAFLRDRASNSWLYVVNRDGTGLRRVLRIRDGVTISGPLSWAPDGSGLVYSAFERPLEQVVRVVRGGRTFTPFRAGGYNAVWLPDGRIGFNLTYAGDVTLTCLVKPVPHAVPRCPLPGDSAVWSPDGRRLAIFRSSPGRPPVLEVRRLDGKLLLRRGDIGPPVMFSPDGKLLLGAVQRTSEGETVQEIVVIRIKTWRRTVLTRGGYDTPADWQALPRR